MGKRLEIVTEQLRRAYMAHVPIIYLVTEDYKLIYDVINSDSLCERRYRIGEYDGIKYLTKAELNDGGIKEDVPACNILDFTGNMSGSFPDIKKSKTPQICLIKNFCASPNGTMDKSIVEYVSAYMCADNSSDIKRSVMLLTGADISLPAGVERYVEIIEVPYPEEDEIREIITSFAAKEKKRTLSHGFLNQLITRLKGFEEYKIIEILSKIKTENGFLCDEREGAAVSDRLKKHEKAYRYIKAEKEKVLKKTRLLSYVDTDKKAEVGGLENMLGWLGGRKKILDNYECAFGRWKLEFSKGVLLAGVPGCGKSLMAKKTAKDLMLPLIRMDIGALQSSFHGQSEANMRSALQLAEASAPCVLWIDEIEKAFSGMKGSGEADGGAGQRAFATFLTWLQENDKPVFVFITSNDVSKLPSELLRLGRISKKYSLFMPSRAECVEIFKASYENIQGDARVFESGITDKGKIEKILDYCAAGKKFLTGADINEIIRETMSQYFLKALDTNDTSCVYKSDSFYAVMKEVIDNTAPYGETNMADIVNFVLLQERNNFESASKEKAITDGVLKKGAEKATLDNAYDNALRQEIICVYRKLNKIQGVE